MRGVEWGKSKRCGEAYSEIGASNMFVISMQPKVKEAKERLQAIQT